jgi:phage major head subunit gpT-like protein
MAIVGSDLVTQWSTLFETLFLNEFNQSVAVERARLDPLTMEIPLADGMGNQVQLDWLGASPQMREWVDEKRAMGLNKYSWSITPKRYEASIEVDLDAFRDARFYVYEPRLKEMAQNASRLRYNLISDLIAGGATANCYDNQYFFDVDHSEGASGTQSNKLTATGQSQAQVEADFYSAKSALMGFKDDQGIPMAPNDFRPLVWVPNNPTLEQKFRVLQGATVISQTSNVLANAFDLVVDPRLGSGTSWYMFRTDGVMKSFIVVNREEAKYEDNFASQSDAVFKQRKGMASTVARMTATYGLWQKGVMVA